MEFFEKAHVSKRSPVKKDSKSEEMVKKQLKQMLHGYKQSDNELIKSSGNTYSDIAEAHKAFDDSTSVSGFSDLDLTKSDDEQEATRVVGSEIYDDNVSSSSDVNIPSLNSEDTDDTNSQDATDKIEQELAEHPGDFLETISEGDEDIESLSQDSVSSDNESIASENSIASEIRDISLLDLLGSSPSSQSVTDDSESFDPDGSLASKIMEKLGKSQSKSSPKSKKRKIEEALTPDSRKGRSKKKSSKTNATKKNQDKSADDIEIENLSIKDNIDDEYNESFEDNNTQGSASTDASSPFISIRATDMPALSLSELLGDYKHPTVRNLPCEKQNIVISANSSVIFPTDDDMQVEDVDSLIPEIGDDPIIEDIEIPDDTVIEESDPIIDSEAIPNKEILTDQSYETELNESNISLSDTPETKLAKHKKNTDIDNIKMYYTDSACIFVLQHPAELYVNGKVKIKLLAGTVEVFGHTLKKEVNLYSPNNSFSQCLKTVKAENVYYGLFNQLTTAGLSVSKAEDVVTTLGEYDGVICMSALQDAKLDFVDSHFTVDMFTKVKVDSTAHRIGKASDRLGCNIYSSKPLRSFENYAVWDEAVVCGLKPRSRGIVCGGKGLGKSTFVRYYINRVLDNGPVLVVDLDPGQAEFTVAGCISATVVSQPLLGPNFTHLQTPDISYNIGMINTMDNTFRYAAAVAQLLQHCHRRFPSMPWIVNTMGMTNNMGLKFILLTIIQAQPTFLVQIDSQIMKKRFESSLGPDAIRMLYENCKYDRLFRRVQFPANVDYNFILTRHMEGSYKQDTSLSPKDERYLNFLAYFGELMYKRVDSFLGIVPYEVSLSELNVLTNVNVPRDAVLKVINGKIVALCQLATTDKGKVFTLRDNAPLCHGHGLVRGVDFANNLVYLVTPVAAERLRDVNTLMYSDWTPELLGTERDLPAGLPVPYRGAAHHKHKQHMLAPRRRFNPLQLLKMSRSA